MHNIVLKLRENCDLPDNELLMLISDDKYREQLSKNADEVRRIHYGTDVYIRGLIEISNYCKNDCLYCGIRCGNKKADRYRLSKEDILSCCAMGYKLGFRTFVMQGGEDNHFTDALMCDIVSNIKEKYPDCAVTLSLGEKSYATYKAYFDAGADRYLLRHETANEEHYSRLHPENLSLKVRKQALFDLKDIGFQVGSGFMVGSPYQTDENLLEDLRFLQELQPDMVGIGPFLSHKDTPFASFSNGDLNKTLRMISILRLMFPKILLPSTTALGTLAEGGREMGIKAGANVVMPNLSPEDTRKLYNLYDNKLATGVESAEGLDKLKLQMKNIGYNVVCARGDSKTLQDK